MYLKCSVYCHAYSWFLIIITRIIIVCHACNWHLRIIIILQHYPGKPIYIVLSIIFFSIKYTLLPESFFFKELYFFFLIYVFLERGREGERERNISVWLSLTWSPLGTWSTTQACALTGNRTSNSLVCSLCLIHWATPARAESFFTSNLNSRLHLTPLFWPCTGDRSVCDLAIPCPFAACFKAISWPRYHQSRFLWSACLGPSPFIPSLMILCPLLCYSFFYLFQCVLIDVVCRSMCYEGQGLHLWTWIQLSALSL